MPILAIVEQVLRIINHLLEATPVDVRRAQTVMMFELVVPLFPEKHRAIMQEAIAKFKEI